MAQGTQGLLRPQNQQLPQGPLSSRTLPRGPQKHQGPHTLPKRPGSQTPQGPLKHQTLGRSQRPPSHQRAPLYERRETEGPPSGPVSHRQVFLLSLWRTCLASHRKWGPQKKHPQGLPSVPLQRPLQGPPASYREQGTLLLFLAAASRPPRGGPQGGPRRGFKGPFTVPLARSFTGQQLTAGPSNHRK